MNKFHFIILAFFFTPATLASIVPENDLSIPVSDKVQGLSENQYHKVINKVEAVYRPIVQSLGKKLTLKRLWKDPTVNAGTTKKGNEIIINLYGGYARHELITEDAYALVMCHELGHHLGGAPKKIISGEVRWPSTEGQADYFATLKCLRKVFVNEDNISAISNLKVPQTVQDKCSLAFKEAREKALCIRTALAGLTNAYISAQIRRLENPSFETFDPSIVDVTFGAHPAPQCRLDTYFQGSICETSSLIPLSGTDELLGTCHPKNGHAEGNRPLCWFKPSDK